LKASLKMGVWSQCMFIVVWKILLYIFNSYKNKTNLRGKLEKIKEERMKIKFSKDIW